jgi:endonuclease-3
MKKDTNRQSLQRPFDTINQHKFPAAKSHMARILKRLKADYPKVRCALNYESPFQLLVATILSAQCTDVRVNLVTRDLFSKYRTPLKLAKAPLKDLEKCIHSTGFFRNKAKNIKACSVALLEQHDGKVPRHLEDLVALPGVGRKTANVVLGTAYGLATGVVVDTHVGRLSRRLGLTREADPVKVERDLIGLLPKKEWIDFSHRIIYHGRAVCSARKPLCDDCSMQNFCPRLGM